jgi:Flp pilus assembly pilin Flp
MFTTITTTFSYLAASIRVGVRRFLKDDGAATQGVETAILVALATTLLAAAALAVYTAVSSSLTNSAGRIR